jgi:hypothetical protein
VKKSLVEAEHNAKLHSKMNPYIDVWVMDKKNKRAVVCAFEFVRKNRILHGWHIVKTFLNGKEVAKKMIEKLNVPKSSVYCNPDVCLNCQYIGEGDSICDITMEVVLSDWQPTESYMRGCPFLKKRKKHKRKKSKR